jgi:glycerol-3-phosphate dehydrogenase
MLTIIEQLRFAILERPIVSLSTVTDSAPRADKSALINRPHADVLIIGGGINGIVTFFDLALQGVDVAMVDRADFLSGIITAPIRLLITHGTGKPSERGALLIKVGLMIYDTFSRDGGNVPRHRSKARKAARSEFPKRNQDVKYTASYYDASMYGPERLALDVLVDGRNAGLHRARSANYVRGIDVSGDSVLLQDKLTGEEFTFTAKGVDNTSGPWTDLTNRALGKPTSFMGGTKG